MLLEKKLVHVQEIFLNISDPKMLAPYQLCVTRKHNIWAMWTLKNCFFSWKSLLISKALIQIQTTANIAVTSESHHFLYNPQPKFIIMITGFVVSPYVKRRKLFSIQDLHLIISNSNTWWHIKIWSCFWNFQSGGTRWNAKWKLTVDFCQNVFRVFLYFENKLEFSSTLLAKNITFSIEFNFQKAAIV